MQPRGDGDRRRRRRGRGASTTTPATTRRIGYDELVIATGGMPIRPDLPGIDLPFVHGVQTLEDAEALLSLADRRLPAHRGRRRRLHRARDGRGVRRAGMHSDGRREVGPHPLGLLDPDLGEQRQRRTASPRDRRARRRRRSPASSPDAVVTSDGADRRRPRHARHRRAPAIGAGERRRASSSA